MKIIVKVITTDASQSNINTELTIEGNDAYELRQILFLLKSKGITLEDIWPYKIE